MVSLQSYFSIILGLCVSVNIHTSVTVLHIRLAGQLLIFLCLLLRRRLWDKKQTNEVDIKVIWSRHPNSLETWSGYLSQFKMTIWVKIIRMGNMHFLCHFFCQFSWWPGFKMSHRRAKKNNPVDKYTKESNGMALFFY